MVLRPGPGPSKGPTHSGSGSHGEKEGRPVVTLLPDSDAQWEDKGAAPADLVTNTSRVGTRSKTERWVDSFPAAAVTKNHKLEQQTLFLSWFWRPKARNQAAGRPHPPQGPGAGPPASSGFHPQQPLAMATSP